MSVAYANFSQFLSFACGVLVEFRGSFWVQWLGNTVSEPSSG